MEQLIRKVLDHCGYDSEATEENLAECFLEYTDQGAFGNLNLEEAKDLIEDGEITIKMMCSNLMKMR